MVLQNVVVRRIAPGVEPNTINAVGCEVWKPERIAAIALERLKVELDFIGEVRIDADAGKALAVHDAGVDHRPQLAG